MFENVIGYTHLKNELAQIIDCLNHKEKYQRFSVSQPSGLVLGGLPGTGKTTLAKDFMAALTNRKSYIIRKKENNLNFILSMSSILDEAIKNAPSVVLFDDIDKYPSDEKNTNNSPEYSTIQSYIDEAKGKDVYFLATTNNEIDLPNSLRRHGRLEIEITVEPPEQKDAELIIKHYLKDKMVSDDIDYGEIAELLEGKSCAALEEILVRAGMYVAFEGRDLITMDDIIRAILREVYDAPEGKNKTPYQTKIAAYHEAGHTLVSEVLERGSVSLASIDNYFGLIGGLTAIKKNEDYFVDINLIDNRLKTLLGGKAATEIVFGIIDTGASSDIQRASNILIRYFNHYFINGFEDALVGYDTTCNRDIVNESLKRKMTELYYDAKNIILVHRDKLDCLAKCLMEKRLLRKKDIKKIMEEDNYGME